MKKKKTRIQKNIEKITTLAQDKIPQNANSEQNTKKINVSPEQNTTPPPKKKTRAQGTKQKKRFLARNKIPTTHPKKKCEPRTK